MNHIFVSILEGLSAIWPVLFEDFDKFEVIAKSRVSKYSSMSGANVF